MEDLTDLLPNARRNGITDTNCKLARALSELHTRQEVERMADELGVTLEYSEDKWSCWTINHDIHGWLFEKVTLTELHDKLVELMKG